MPVVTQNISYPTRRAAAVAKYQASEKAKQTIAAYNRSEARRRSLEKYNSSEKKTIVSRRYLRTEKAREHKRNRTASIEELISRRLRDRVRKVLKRGKGVRAGSAIRDLGCSLVCFKAFIEGQFDPGMSWENYGRWHLDHVKPLAIFDLSDRSQFLDAVHWTNYQPLWAKDNLRKGARHG
jgi:hypothetical protein